MLKFLWIYNLFFLPLPVFAYYFLKPVKNEGIKYALKVPFFYKLNQDINKNITGKINNIIKNLLLLLSWILLCMAAARPVYVGKPMQIETLGRDVMLAVDISGSMQVKDFKIGNNVISRIQAVKNAASDFIEKRKGDRVGVIVFGSKPYVISPFSHDVKTVKKMLNDTDIGLAGERTSIGDTIALAIKYFKENKPKYKILVLLTDGENNIGILDPIEAAKIAKNDGVKIYTIGVGSSGGFIDSFFGKQFINPSQDLDEDTLIEIAEITKGLFFRAENTNGLRKIYSKIDNLEPTIGNKKTARPKTELYYIPLSISFVLLFIALIFNKRRGDG